MGMSCTNIILQTNKVTAMEELMQLYEFAPTRSIRVRWMLQELDLKFESVIINLKAGDHRRPEFLMINPAHKLPVLVDGDLVLTESVAIVLYLAEKYPEKGFIPTDIRDRAEVYRWLLFTVTELEQPLWRIARQTSLYSKELRIPADIALARQDFTDMAAVLEKHMQGRDFIATDRVTVADFVCAYTLDWANEVRLCDDFPQLHGYMEKMYDRTKAPPRIAAALASIKSQ